MEIKEGIASIEAILFASGEAVDIERLSQATDIDAETIEKLCLMLSDRLDKEGSAIKIVKLNDSFQMTTRKEYAQVIRKAIDVRKNTPLSQAALEVLSVVSYNQPVTKGFVEQVRGVDCSGVVNSLVEKGLLEEKGRLELPGRPLLYGTTSDFLRCFQISSLSELPPIPNKNQEGEDIPIEEFMQKQEE